MVSETVIEIVTTKNGRAPKGGPRYKPKTISDIQIGKGRGAPLFIEMLF